MFLSFFLLKGASKTMVTETFRKNIKNIKNFPKKEGFLK